MIKLVKRFMYASSRVGEILPTPNHLAIAEGPGVKGVWVEETPHIITGDLETWASIANVKPSRIPGYWLDRPGADIPIGQKPAPGEKVLYSLHGGAYTKMSAHPKHPVSFVARGILEHCEPFQRAFSIEYRLSAAAPYMSANPFPTALIDALAGYNYLVNTVGFDPSDIIVEGDSAGGNLALALTRYLVEYSKLVELPATPAGIILLSPWVDLGISHSGPNSSSSIFDMDYLGELETGSMLWSKQAFLSPHGMAEAATNRYISPASLEITGHFKGFPKTFIVNGGAERLYDSIVTLKKRMVADMGEGGREGQVMYHEAPDAVHDYLVFPWHEPERTNTLQAISKWV
jgi:acetyl esterase/lipase